MKAAKRKRLEAAGWKVGDVAEFLGLTAVEASFVKYKVSLARAVRAERRKLKLTQERVARLLGSSQSRVAKLEAADASVTVDLLLKTLLKLRARKPVSAAAR